MKWLFWASVAMLAYTYFGYAGWLWLRRRYRPRPVQVGECAPSISIVMVVRNEATVLDRKLRNLLALNYGTLYPALLPVASPWTPSKGAVSPTSESPTSIQNARNVCATP